MDERENCEDHSTADGTEEVVEEENYPLHEEEELKISRTSKLVLVKGPLFDFCSAAITIVISFAVVINYLIISERVKLKDLPYGMKHEEAVYVVDHQKVFSFPNAEITSLFDSGNARSVVQNSPYEFEIKVGGEASARTRRWFHFKVSNVQQPVTMTFYISNMTLDKEMLQNGAIPVFKSDSSAGLWAKIEYITRLRQIDSNEMEMEFSYQFDPAADGIISFALAFPWTYKNNQMFYKKLAKLYQGNPTIFLEKHLLTKTPDKNSVNILFISSMNHLDLKNRTEFSGIKFPTVLNTKKLFVLGARLHGFESVSSAAMRNAVKFLLADTPESKRLLDEYLFVVVPMINPDSVKLGLNRVDAAGVDPQLNITDTHPLKLLVGSLATQENYKGILIFRSSLDKNMISFSVPVIEANASRRHLDLPVHVSLHNPKVVLKKCVNATSSPLLHYLAGLNNKSVAIEVNIPTMKKSKLTQGQVISTDIETIINGRTAAQGGLGIRQNTKRIMLGLYKSLVPQEAKTQKEKNAKNKLVNHLAGVSVSGG